MTTFPFRNLFCLVSGLEVYIGVPSATLVLLCLMYPSEKVIASLVEKEIIFSLEGGKGNISGVRIRVHLQLSVKLLLPLVK